MPEHLLKSRTTSETLRFVGILWAQMTARSRVRYSSDQLIEEIRLVTRRARPDDPTKVTQREFDQVRRETAANCPSAAKLVVRFGITWSELLMTANQQSGAFRALRVAETGYEPQRADRATCVAAVRRAADRRGQTTLLPREYEEERHKAIAGSKRVTRERLEIQWPVLSQIQKFGWADLLADAGIEPPPKSTGWGLHLSDAMELVLRCRGYAPTAKEARQFAKSHGISVSDIRKPPDEAFRELTERRNKIGKWTPPRTLPGRWEPKPTFEESLKAEIEELERDLVRPYREANPSRPRNYWTGERILTGLEYAISKLEPGEALTQRALRRLSIENPGKIPSPTTVTDYGSKHGTNLSELRAEARKRLERNHS